MSNYTVLVKLMNSVVILGIKAESEQVARDLALEYFDKMGYDDVQISSCQEGLMPIDDIRDLGEEVLDAIPPSQFKNDLLALRELVKSQGPLPRYKPDFEEAKKINKELDDVEEGLPPWDLSEDDKCMFMKYGISSK